MEKDYIYDIGKKTRAEKTKSKISLNKSAVTREVVLSLSTLILTLLLFTRKMLFDTSPLAFSLLCASGRHTPFALLGIIIGAFSGGRFDLSAIVGACFCVLMRVFSKLFLESRESDPKKTGQSNILGAYASFFSEHTYLRVMSSAVSVFIIGIWRIIEGGFRFYDLFAAIFSLLLAPVGAFFFSKFFIIGKKKLESAKNSPISVQDERIFDLSTLLLGSAFVFSLGRSSLGGINLALFFALIITLIFCKRGVLYGIVAGLLLGLSYTPSYAPMLAFCAIAYVGVCKLSLFGSAIASCIAGLIWGIYVDGVSAIGTVFPALLSASMVFCAAEKINVFEDVWGFLKSKPDTMTQFAADELIAKERIISKDEKLRSISDSFSSLSEIFYNLSSKLKRPTVLDLRAICESSFDKTCRDCEGYELCYGAQYTNTLDAMKKMTLELHSHGAVDVKRVPEAFKKSCIRIDTLTSGMNTACAIATKKAFQNEKTEIFALDYDAISKILNDAIAENEDDFKIDGALSKKISKIIADEGYGEHNVIAFGKRKLKILARGLDLCDKASDITTLRQKLEKTVNLRLTEPTFELAFGSVNMHLEAKRAFLADAAFKTSQSAGESVCGDTVSIFENSDDYLYALISDGMGTGKNAALTSEICNVFLRNMLSAGNKMETSLRMLNSVLRTRGARSENECSATVDLLRLDLYSGELTLVKSGAAPTFVVRRENVFKLASPSFPIGILHALDAKQLDIKCEDGDLVVMVSDGAARQGDDCSYLCDLLRDPKIVNDSPDKIADKIIRRARSESDVPMDDISVVVVRVKKDGSWFEC